MQQPYPKADSSKINIAAIEELEWVKMFIIGIRKIRSEMNISPSKPLTILLDNMNKKDKQYLLSNKLSLTSLAKAASITILSKEDIVPEAAISLVGEMKILIPLDGLIDKKAEIARLAKEVSKLEAEVKRFIEKLSNQKFISKAPEKIILKEKQKLIDSEIALKNMKEQYEKFNNS